MVKQILAMALTATALAAQAVTIDNVTATETQAVIRYAAPDLNACTVQISESPSLTPLVHDVDPVLFPGSNLDSRVGDTSNGTQRVFVAGKRDAEVASDGRRYSRALKAFTQHYYQITCDGISASGTFQTADPLLGNGYVDTPPFDPTAYGNYGWPTIDWADQSKEYVDPLTGLLLKRVSFSQPNAVIDSATSGNSNYAQPEAVQDGGSFYTSGTSCAGTNWTNPCAALASDGIYASYGGSASSPLEVMFYKDSSDPFTTSWAVPLSNFQVTVLGYGTDASPANRTVNVCLSAHVYTGACGTGSFPIVLPQSSAAGVTYPATPDTQSLLASWLDSTHTVPLSVLDVFTRNTSVTINGTTMTYVSGDTFGENLAAGDHVTVPGSSPACPNNDCVISAVTSANTIALQENLGNFNGGGAVAATFHNFGAILTKTTSTGSVYIDYVSNQQDYESYFSNISSGQSFMFSPTTLSVCVDFNGNPISPCRNAYGFMAPLSNTASAWMLFFPDNGEVRYIDPLAPPNTGGTDGYSHVYCRETGESFDPGGPNKVYCLGLDATGENAALVSGTYNYNPSAGCDYRNWAGAFTGTPGNPCVTWQNESPLSTGNGLTTQVQNIWPAYDPAYDGGLNQCSVSRDGRYMSFYTEQGFGPLVNPQDTFGVALFYDLTAKQFVQKFDTYTKYPARFGQMHGCPSEYFSGYNNEDIDTYDYMGNPRGSADYQLVINSITGRSDLSLDPVLPVSSISQASPPVITTAVPHQLGNSGTSAVYFNENTDGLYSGPYYCKPLTSTTCALYQDAAFTQPLPTPPYAFQYGGMTGVWVISNLVGGTGCTGTSFTVGPISDVGGTGATIQANISGGSVTSVVVTAGGSGYLGPVYVPLTGNSCSGASVILNPQYQHMHTMFAQACPTVSTQWQALGVTPGALDCVTLNLAADPVKIYKPESATAATGVYKINILNGGTGYTSPPTLTITGGGGSGATATASISGGAITGVTVTAHGSGYLYPRAAFSESSGCTLCTTAHGAVVTSGGVVTAVNLSGAGVYEPLGGWYTSTPTVTITGPGSGAAATAVLGTSGELSDITVSSGGSGYLEPPIVTISGGGGSGATAIATVSNGVVTGFTVTNPGSGYTSAPSVTLSGGYGTGASGTPVLVFPVASVAVTNGGSGYVPPAVSVSGGGGTGAALSAGLYEEMSAFPYPHNAGNCGGDGTTAHCWTQPLTLQEGDTFTMLGDPSYYEHPFFVQVIHNSDGTITGTIARFVGAGNSPILSSGQFISGPHQYYSHRTPIAPTMRQAESQGGLLVVYSQSDLTASNPMAESPEVNMHGDDISPVGQPALDALVSNDGSYQHVRIGAPSVEIGQNYQYSLPDTVGFNGSKAQLSRGIIQTHPSTRQYAAPGNELVWSVDMRPLSTDTGSVSNVFQNTATQVGSCSGSVCLYDVTNPSGFDIKNVPLAAWAGEHLLQDKSGPGSVMSLPGDVWKYCYSYNAGECVSGSPAGHLYMAVDKGVPNGQCGVYYNLNVPCVVSPTPDFSNYVQQGYSQPNLNGSDWRRLGFAFGGWARNLDGFQNMRATPDGSWAIAWTGWVDGVSPAMFAVKLPPWPGGTPQNLSQFVQIPVPVEAQPGMVEARIYFGYAENGPPGNFYCTTRQEACTTGGSPFAFASETQATSCATGCVLTIPAIPRRIVYYEIDGLNSSGKVMSRSPMYVDVADQQLQLLRRRWLLQTNQATVGLVDSVDESRQRTNSVRTKTIDQSRGAVPSPPHIVHIKRWDHSVGH